MERRVFANWIIAIAVAAVYLAVSVLSGAWAYTWVIWVAYAAGRIAHSRIAEQNG